MRKSIKSSLYKGVYFCTKEKKWIASITKMKWRKRCDTEYQAAKEYDLKLISKGAEPVNVLIKK